MSDFSQCDVTERLDSLMQIMLNMYMEVLIYIIICNFMFKRLSFHMDTGHLLFWAFRPYELLFEFLCFELLYTVVDTLMKNKQLYSLCQ